MDGVLGSLEGLPRVERLLGLSTLGGRRSESPGERPGVDLLRSLLGRCGVFGGCDGGGSSGG